MLGEREQERLMRHLDFFAGELGDYPRAVRKEDREVGNSQKRGDA